VCAVRGGGRGGGADGEFVGAQFVEPFWDRIGELIACSNPHSRDEPRLPVFFKCGWLGLDQLLSLRSSVGKLAAALFGWVFRDDAVQLVRIVVCRCRE